MIAKSALPLSFIIGSRFFGLFIILPVISVYALELKGATEFLVGVLIGVYAISQIAAEYFDRPRPNRVPEKFRNKLIPRKLKKRWCKS